MKRKLAIGLMTAGCIGVVVGCVGLTVGFAGLAKAIKGGERHV